MIVIVSQFTLLASTKKGNKPDFHLSANAEDARNLYQHFLDTVKNLYESKKVEEGVFQAMMDVSLINDGPVSSFQECSKSINSIIIESKPLLIHPE